MIVENKIQIYELNETNIDSLHGVELIVKSHFPYDDRVVLVFDNDEITVLARDLVKAVANATNK